MENQEKLKKLVDKRAQALLGGGEKVSYIVATLADRYHVSERKVYTLIKRYGRECSAQVLRG